MAENFLVRWITWCMDDNPKRSIYDNMPNRNHRRLSAGGSSMWLGSEGMIARVHKTKDGGWYIISRLPNILTNAAHNDIRRAAERCGVPVLYTSEVVLDRAMIMRSSVKVLDQQAKAPFLRPRHVLFSASVHGGDSVRQAYFLSGYDVNERNSYFLCEVAGEPQTIAEAYEALKPKSVKVAEAQGRKVRRQGDMFFIKAKRSEIPNDDVITAKLDYDAFLFGSNHTVSQCVQTEGVLFVRGKVRHRPRGRRPDHKTLHLPPGWWIAVQNAVPIVDMPKMFRPTRPGGRW